MNPASLLAGSGVAGGGGGTSLQMSNSSSATSGADITGSSLTFGTGNFSVGGNNMSYWLVAAVAVVAVVFILKKGR